MSKLKSVPGGDFIFAMTLMGALVIAIGINGEMEKERADALEEELTQFVEVCKPLLSEYYLLAIEDDISDQKRKFKRWDITADINRCLAYGNIKGEDKGGVK